MAAQSGVRKLAAAVVVQVVVILVVVIVVAVVAWARSLIVVHHKVLGTGSPLASSVHSVLSLRRRSASFLEGREPADVVPEGGGRLALGLGQHEDLLLGESCGQRGVLLTHQEIVVRPGHRFGLPCGVALTGVQHGLLLLHLGQRETCLLVRQHLSPLIAECSEPSLFELGFLGAQQVQLVS